MSFGIESLQMDTEICYLMLLKHIFDKCIKKYINAKGVNLEAQAGDIKAILSKFKDLQDQNKLQIRKNSIPPANDSFEKHLLNELKCLITKDLWVDSFRMIESIKRTLPNGKVLIQIIIEYAYLSYLYQYISFLINPIVYI